MAISIDTFTENIRVLIRNFEADRSHYLSKGYLEAQARVDFITPFFDALGWDVRNQAGLTFQDRDVIVEKGDIDTTGRPDYSFRVGGQTKFFVEAKAPAEGLSNPRHTIQAKKYAWNTRQVFFVVLTDFVEFRFYDASIQPDERRPDEGLLLKLSYSDYISHAKELWQFSKQRVIEGSLDAMLPRDLRTQRLRIPVDQVFLDEMTQWRSDLAKDIYKNNSRLTAKQLNEVVQRLLDRIVFIRIAEDRRIIEKRQLADAVDGWKARGGKFDISEWLRPLFDKINEDFNGEIFKPNELLDRTKVDSAVLAHIIERLYPPKSPYRFDVIGVELLGSIYERYLGNTIRTTAQQVKIEEKPEVRKAGGVYYTPQYIVEYIVKNTVGKLIEGKTPRQIEKIRILDPACGSGSFLIGAFQYLIDYYVRYLSDHPKEAHVHPLYPDILRDENGDPRLSVVRKAQILRNNLYGVDIDPQAVEITMMSLYLKALEGEKSQLPPKQHLLPELKYNIVCGNSLIGTEIRDQGTFFGDKEIDRINAFNWQDAYPGIMRDGGFDVVIGNPPWLMAGYYLPRDIEYFQQKFKCAVGKFDLYYLFIEQGAGLLLDDGYFGMIVPNKFFHTRAAGNLRKFLSEHRWLRQIVDFGDEHLFHGATNYSCILLMRKSRSSSPTYVKSKAGLLIVDEFKVPWSSLQEDTWHFAPHGDDELFQKLEKEGTALAEITHRFGTGVQSGADRVLAFDRAVAKTEELEQPMLRPVLRGRDVRQYLVAADPKLLIFPYAVVNEEFKIVAEAQLSRYRHVYRHLLANKTRLSQRIWFGKNAQELSGKWYGMMYLDSYKSFAAPHILTPSLSDRCNFALGTGDLFATGTAGVTSVILDEDLQENILYLLGVLNSSLITFYATGHSPIFSGGYYKFSAPYLKRLPIRRIDFSKSGDRSRHDRIVTLVQRILDQSQKKQTGGLVPSELNRLERDIATSERQVADIVYELYGFSGQERRIVEDRLANRTSKHATQQHSRSLDDIDAPSG